MFILDEETQERIAHSFHVPAKPKLLQQLESLQHDTGEKSLFAAAEIIAQDVGLSGIVLQTINSPIFGLTRQVTDIKQAVIALGLKILIPVIQMGLLKQSFPKSSAISFERFWDESYQHAVVCRYLAQSLSLNFVPELLYSLGLFHNVGIASMALKYDNYADVLKKANASECFTQVEMEAYQTDHCQVGYVISDNWGLPEKLCNVIAFHHSHHYIREAVPYEQQELCALLHCAKNICRNLRTQQDELTWTILKAHILDVLELTDNGYQKLQTKVIDKLNLSRLNNIG